MMSFVGDLTLDGIDLRIIRELQLNGRISNKTLASLVGLSPSACLARVRRLERSGVISGYATHLSSKAVGAVCEGWVSLTLTQRTPATVAIIRGIIAEIDVIVEAYEVVSTFDLLLHVVTRDLYQWRSVEESLAASGVVASARFGLVAASLKAHAPWPLAAIFSPPP